MKFWKNSPGRVHEEIFLGQNSGYWVLDNAFSVFTSNNWSLLDPKFVVALNSGWNIKKLGRLKRCPEQLSSFISTTYYVGLRSAPAETRTKGAKWFSAAARFPPQCFCALRRFVRLKILLNSQRRDTATTSWLAHSLSLGCQHGSCKKTLTTRLNRPFL